MNWRASDRPVDGRWHRYAAAGRRAGMVSRWFGLLACCLLALRQAAADPDALWYIVAEQCIPDQQQFQSPKPCEVVDLAAGTVVLKDRVGATQFLLLPTTRVTGIESQEVRGP